MRPRSENAQALVELALVTPLLVGVVALLFQLGVLLVAYLSVLHAGRDVGRWLAVHPDTTDAQLQSYATAHAPSTVDAARLTVTASPACPALSSGRCGNRPSGATVRVRLQYDAGGHVFLPTTLAVGFARFTAPTGLPAYDYHVVMENR
jgi:Flp pilus assembly protein TadG